MDKTDYTQYSHLYVKLEDEESIFYASVNFEHVKDLDGICPTGRLHVYLLHPEKGSVIFHLENDAELNLYVLEPGTPEIDSLIIDDINESIKQKFNNV